MNTNSLCYRACFQLANGKRMMCLRPFRSKALKSTRITLSAWRAFQAEASGSAPHQSSVELTSLVSKTNGFLCWFIASPLLTE